jgi:hypothetical protein
MMHGSDFLDGFGNIRFKLGETISAYLKEDPIDTSNSAHLVSSYAITKITPNISNDSVKITIDAMDKTSQLLSKSGAKNYYGSAPVMIRDIMKNWASEINADLDTDGGYITTTPGGTATSFIVKSYPYTYKPIFDAVNELSQKDYTGDDNAYIYWVDSSNNFHWEYPGNTVATALVEGAGNIKDIDIEKSEQDEVNMIIYNAGKDKEGNSILWYKFNILTKSGTLKIAYYDWSEITTNMQLPGYTEINWSSATNNEVRDYAKVIGAAKCDKIFTERPLVWKGTIRLSGTRSIARGTLVSLTSHKFGDWGNESTTNFRVVDVAQSVSSRGWWTTITLEEEI